MTSERASATLNLMLTMSLNGGQPMPLRDLMLAATDPASATDASGWHQAINSGLTLSGDLISIDEHQIEPVLSELKNYSGPVWLSGQSAELTVSADMHFTIRIGGPSEGHWHVEEDDVVQLALNTQLALSAARQWDAASHLWRPGPPNERQQDTQLQNPTSQDAGSDEATIQAPDVSDATAVSTSPHKRPAAFVLTDTAAEVSSETLLEQTLDPDAMAVARRLARQDGVDVISYLNELILFQE